MAVTVKTKDGKDKILLNPQEKRDKYYQELALGEKITNNYEPKNQRLNDVSRAYRAGYLAAQNESAKIFKKKHPKYKRVADRWSNVIENVKW